MAGVVRSSHVPGPPGAGRPLRLGLISDTHGVLCAEVLQRLRGVDLILHAGDVGHHGGAAEVLARLAAVAPVYAVRGNVDEGDDDTHSGDDVSAPDGGGGSGDADVDGNGGAARGGNGVGGRAGDVAARVPLPSHRLVEVPGWRILLTHIVGQPPQTVEPTAAALIRRHEPHIVVFGHSHKSLALSHGGRHYYNPGSAGPARFKLPRTAALLELPSRDGGPGGPADAAREPEPAFTLIQLAPRAPPRLAAKQRRSRSGGAAATALPGPSCVAASAARGTASDEVQPPVAAAAAAAEARDAGAPRSASDDDDDDAGGGGALGGEAAARIPESKRRTYVREAGTARGASTGDTREGQEVRGVATAGSGSVTGRWCRDGMDGGAGPEVRQASVGKRRRAADAS